MFQMSQNYNAAIKIRSTTVELLTAHIGSGKRREALPLWQHITITHPERSCITMGKSYSLLIKDTRSLI